MVIIGPTGNCNQDNKYIFDCQAFTNSCSVDDILRVQVLEQNGYLTCPVEVIVTGAGLDVAPNMTLTKDFDSNGIGNTCDPILPTNFTIFRGFHNSGNLNDLFSSDDSYLNVRAGITLSSGEAPIQIEFITTAPTNSTSELKFSVESAMSTPNVQQEIQLFNYVTGLYEQVDVRVLTTSDSVAEVIISSNPDRFINSNNEMKAKIKFKAIGITLMWTWSARIDHVFWILE